MSSIATVVRAHRDGALHTNAFDLIEVFQAKVARRVGRARGVHDVIDDARAQKEILVQQRTVHLSVDVDDHARDLHTEPGGKQTVASVGRGQAFRFQMVVDRVERIRAGVVVEVGCHAFEARQARDVVEEAGAHDEQRNKEHGNTLVNGKLLVSRVDKVSAHARTASLRKVDTVCNDLYARLCSLFLSLSLFLPPFFSPISRVFFPFSVDLLYVPLNKNQRTSLNTSLWVSMLTTVTVRASSDVL